MKKAYFFVDDVIWTLRDLTRQKPANLFDNPFMKTLKTAHEKYGLKVQMNLFYRTDSFYGYDVFTLSEVTDAYKAEFEEASEWLKFAVHAFEEFPDYAHLNATYEDTYWLFKTIEKEVFRFAGKNSFAYSVCPHWLTMSKAGVKALKDCGVKLLDVTAGDTREYDGNPDSLPYGHALRLLNNRQEEAKVFCRGGRDVAIARSISGYNHIDDKTFDETAYTLKTIYNEEFDIQFKKYGLTTLNLIPYDEIEKDFEELTQGEYVGICDHEQYFYSDYLAYQPDYADKIYKMCEVLKAKGFEFVCGEELLN